MFIYLFIFIENGESGNLIKTKKPSIKKITKTFRMLFVFIYVLVHLIHCFIWLYRGLEGNMIQGQIPWSFGKLINLKRM